MGCDWYIVGTSTITLADGKKYTIEFKRKRRYLFPDIYEPYTDSQQEDPEIEEMLDAQFEDQMYADLSNFPSERTVYENGKIADDEDEEDVLGNIKSDDTLYKIYRKKYKDIFDETYFQVRDRRRRIDIDVLKKLDIVKIVENYSAQRRY